MIHINTKICVFTIKFKIFMCFYYSLNNARDFSIILEKNPDKLGRYFTLDILITLLPCLVMISVFIKKMRKYTIRIIIFKISDFHIHMEYVRAVCNCFNNILFININSDFTENTLFSTSKGNMQFIFEYIIIYSLFLICFCV